MTKRMLIDAAHPEETRVVIVDGTRVEELDFESSNKRQLRGNVYLAKVTRVEPSLQAAFIDYGGNRHGFLAFSEIHPDYYQLPYEDKLALQEQEAEELKDLENDDDDDVEEDKNLDPDDDDATDENDAEIADEQVKVASKRRKRMNRRRYKIQEVIKRGQILLVQAVKEERGNKGAAMTTYLSLAGRYCVLMPNTPRGGGISRKIPNGADRKRLRTIVDGLDVPQGVGVIVRTAGAKRTKAEITRDYNYLSRLWDDIRDTTLKSVAPALIHEEGNLVKRSIRDLYNKEIEEVLVQGEEAYKTAKSFIKMLMPSHAKFVQRYDEDIPLFLRFNVEQQIENSLDAVVQLSSGGYLVIHPTEALVSVDVNSGRSTKERNVERTALKTNLEAAEELARQMRLRDLAGLIVVDFIDMDENKNNRAVERKMKEVLSRDRARIQTSRISQFGLMEISRQRRRRSLLEGSTTICPHCTGVGRKRTVESAALAAIRAVEEFAIRGKAGKIRLKCPPDVALYLLNEKRDLLTKVDEDTDVFTIIEHDDELIRPAFLIEVAEKRNDGRSDPLIAIEKEIEKEQKESKSKAAESKRKSRSKKKDDDDSDQEDEQSSKSSSVKDDDEDSQPKRRRGRRGGRNRRKKSSDDSPDTQSEVKDSSSGTKSDKDEKKETEETQSKSKSPSRSGSRRKAPGRKSDDSASNTTEDAKDEAETAQKETGKKETGKKETGKRSTRRRKAPSKSSSDKKDSDKSTPSEDGAPKSKDADKPKADAASSSSRRRKAPARSKAAIAVEPDEKAEDTKPKRKRRKASPARSSETSETETAADSEKTDKKDTATTSRRRRAAPKKPSANDAKSAPDGKGEETPKPSRRKRATPAKSKAEATESAAKDSGDAESKPKRRRAAPKRAAPKRAAAKSPAPEKQTDADTTSDSKTRRRKAPAKATSKPKASAKATTADNAPSSSDEKSASSSVSDGSPSSGETPRRRAAPSKKKRGLIERLMGKE